MNDPATILAVDDTSESLALLVDILTQAGFHVRPADSGELALEAVAAGAPDLILLDVRMKGMDGLEVCRRLKAQESTRHIPIILISAFYEVKEWVTGLKMGAADYISKPFQIEELLTRIQAQLALSRASAALDQRTVALRKTNKQLQSEISKRRLMEDELHRTINRSERSRQALLSVLEDQKHARSVAESLNLLLTALVNSPQDINIFSLDLEYRYTAFNEKHRLEMKESMNVEIQVGMNIFELINIQAVKDALKQSIDRALNKESFSEIHRQSEQGLNYESSWNPIFSQNEVVGVTVFKRDITERRRAQDELSASEIRYRRIFESATDGILILDSKTGIIVDANPSFTVIIGYTREWLIGKSIKELGAFSEIYDKQSTYLLREDFQFIRYEDLPLETAAGLTIEVEFISNVYIINQKKILQYNIRDITQRRQAEKELRVRNLILSTQQETSLDGILVVDENGKIASSNRRFADMWGIPIDIIELRSDERTLQSVMNQLVDPEEFMIKVQHLYENHGETSRDDILLRDGKCFDRYSAPILDAESKYFGRVWYFRDVTERKKAEKEIRDLNIDLEKRVEKRTALLNASNKELEAFAYSVSHDLRAPLRAIDGFSRFLMDDYKDKLDSEGQRLLNVIRTNTKRMDELIIALLTLSRLNKTDLSYSRVDMKTMVDSIYHEVNQLNAGASVVLTINPLPDAFADATLMRQVWSNLLSNALKYTLPKAIRQIEIGGYSDYHSNIYYIRDNGVGFNSAYVHKLFGVFQRLHKSEDFEGTGIGLAIVQRIVQRHEGIVWAEGRLNEGAVFYFSLPIKELNHDQPE